MISCRDWARTAAFLLILYAVFCVVASFALPESRRKSKPADGIKIFEKIDNCAYFDRKSAKEHESGWDQPSLQTHSLVWIGVWSLLTRVFAGLWNRVGVALVV